MESDLTSIVLIILIDIWKTANILSKNVNKQIIGFIYKLYSLYLFCYLVAFVFFIFQKIYDYWLNTGWSKYNPNSFKV